MRKNLRQVQYDIGQRLAAGLPVNTRQEQRINDIRSQQGRRELNQQEIDVLQLAEQMELDDALANRDMRDYQELNQYKKQQARGESVGNQGRFDELLGQEKTRRNTQKRQKTEKNIGNALGVGAAGLAAGAGAAGVSALLNGGEIFPFSLGIGGGNVGELAKKAALIERETEKRMFEDALAQETVASQTKLANDLYARQQKGALDTQMAIAAQAAMAAPAAGGSGIDIENKVKVLAGQFVAEGVEPSVAINRAIDIVSMDGRANNYL